MKKVVTKWIMRLPETGQAEIKVKKGAQVKTGELIASVEEKEYFYVSIAGATKGWSKEKLENWKNNILNRNLGINEVLVDRVAMEREGKVVGMDEFGRVVCESVIGHIKKLHAPVDAEVNKIEKDKIVLSFDAWEISGEGWGKGKVWGDREKTVVDKSIDMKGGLKDKVVLMKDVDQVKLSKAEVIGVAGIIIISEDKINYGIFDFEIPVVAADSDKLAEVLEKLEKKDDVRIMVNSNTGRVLFVVQ